IMISSRLKVIAAPERRLRPIVGPKEKTHPIGAGWVRESAALPTRLRVHTTSAQHVAHPHADRIRRCWIARQTGPLFLSPQDRVLNLYHRGHRVTQRNATEEGSLARSIKEKSRSGGTGRKIRSEHRAGT